MLKIKIKKRIVENTERSKIKEEKKKKKEIEKNKKNLN